MEASLLHILRPAVRFAALVSAFAIRASTAAASDPSQGSPPAAPDFPTCGVWYDREPVVPSSLTLTR